MGTTQRQMTKEILKKFPKRNVFIFSKRNILYLRIWFPETLPAGKFMTSFTTRKWELRETQWFIWTLTHMSREFLDNRLGGIMDIYTKFTGVDPRDEPMKIFPAVHYSMGGLWTDYGPDQSWFDRSRLTPQSDD